METGARTSKRNEGSVDPIPTEPPIPRAVRTEPFEPTFSSFVKVPIPETTRVVAPMPPLT